MSIRSYSGAKAEFEYKISLDKSLKNKTESNMTDIQQILNEREKTHGDYGSHAAITQALKADMQCQSSWSSLPEHQRETLDMIAHKIGRILAGDPDFRDHWVDIAGYATLSADRCSK